MAFFLIADGTPDVFSESEYQRQLGDLADRWEAHRGKDLLLFPQLPVSERLTGGG